MKKLIIIVIALFLAVPLFSQRTQLDFSVQLQNTNMHDAIIYPNPTSDQNFKIKSSSVIINVEVLNMIGKTIYQKSITNYSFDDISVRLPDCEKGVYLVRITFDDSQVIIKKLFYQ